jgi:hypothetical protein
MHVAHVVLAVVVLAGCSSSPGTAEPAQPQVDPASPPVAQPTAIADLPSAIRCEGFDARPEEAPDYVAEFGTCYLWGEVPPNPVTLYGFANESDMAKFWTANADAGMTPEQAVTLGLIVIYPEAPEDLPKLKDDLGVS